MLSLKIPNKQQHALKVANISGPDFSDATNGVYLYENPKKSESHYEESYNISHALADIYSNAINTKKNGTSVTLNDEYHVPPVQNSVQLYGHNKFSLAPDREQGQTHCIFVVGRPGSGKSYFIGQYIKNYLKYYKDDEPRILLFSRKNINEEPAFESFADKIQQIDIESDDFLSEPYSVKDIRALHEKEDRKVPSLFVFDDINSMPAHVQKAVRYTQSDVIKAGRSFKISTISSEHEHNNGVKTKDLWNQLTHAVVFPFSQKSKVIDTLQKRFKFKPPVIDFITEMPTRWVCVNQQSDLVLSETFCAQITDINNSIKKK